MSPPAVAQAVGDSLVESIVTDNIPILTEQEKFNETAVSSVKRIAAVLRGQEDPGPPERADTTRTRTFKTKVRAVPRIAAGRHALMQAGRGQGAGRRVALISEWRWPQGVV